MERNKVYELIDSERNYQDRKWAGTRSSNQPGEGALDRTIDEYSLYIQGYADELTKVASHSNDVKIKLDVVRKIAGLCVACMEKHGGRPRE